MRVNIQKLDSGFVVLFTPKGVGQKKYAFNTYEEVVAFLDSKFKTVPTAEKIREMQRDSN